MDPEIPQHDDELESAVRGALGEDPRSDELRHMKSLLQQRRAWLTGELDGETDAAAKARLKRELKELDEQIRVLGEEAEITKFVEDAVRVGLEMRRLQSG